MFPGIAKKWAGNRFRGEKKKSQKENAGSVGACSVWIGRFRNQEECKELQ